MRNKILLNSVTKKTSFRLPRDNDTLDALAHSRIFLTLNPKNGYRQVELDLKDREKTAFTVRTTAVAVMPFGLCNAPAAFERLMETMLRSCLLPERYR